MKTKVMTRKEFIEVLLSLDCNEITVVSSPDWNGGRYLKVTRGIVPTSELEEFEYIEWEGTLTDVVRCRHEEFEDTSCGKVFTLEELVLMMYQLMNEVR